MNRVYQLAYRASKKSDERPHRMWRNANHVTKPVRVALLSLGLAACGSQIDTLEDPIVRRESSAPAGIYTGTLTRSESGTRTPVTALLSAERFFLFDEEGALIAGGVYETAALNLTWRARSFERFIETIPPAEDDEDGEPQQVERQRVSILTAEGGFDPDESLLLSFSLAAEGTAGANDSGTLTLTYSRRQHRRRSDLPLTAGRWSNEDPFGSATATFNIGQGGELFGQDQRGCSYSGSLSLIDQRFNLYGSSLQVQCPGASSVALLEAGLATLRLEDDLSETLTIVSSSTRTATLLQLRKGN